MKKKLFYAETSQGCGIREAETIEQAENKFMREAGLPTIIREATINDIAWVKGMGGYIPDGWYGINGQRRPPQ